MKQNRTTNIILAGFILVALIVCGIIGYINDSGRVYPFTTETGEATPTDTPADIELVYCYSPVSLCVISFGSDSAGNMLVVIRNNIPNLAEFYAKIKQTETPNLYPCQKVRFTRDVYYCLGSPIADGTMVTMDVYSKNDDRLVASGSLLVSVGATPMPTATETPIVTEVPTDTTSIAVTQPATP
jgi:hypothetical protein